MRLLQETPHGSVFRLSLQDCEHNQIQRGGIRSAVVRAIADEQLVFQRQGLGSDRTDASSAEELHERNHQVAGQDEEIAHRTNATMPGLARKTASPRRIRLYFRFATHRH
jgi:hypothetical protein